MELITILLILIAVVIVLIPTEPEEDFPKEFRRLVHCDRHEWIQKPNNVDDGYYTVCSNCKFLPDSGGYEP